MIIIHTKVMNDSELHLLIIWERARYKQTEIMEDLAHNLKVYACYEVEWTRNRVSQNFTRFYGVNLPSHSFKELECGIGKFLLLVLKDEKPVYETRTTSHGEERVNVTMFDLKSKYRAWTGGGHKIHATNNPAETNHNLTLLLGVTYDEFLEQHQNPWNGEIIQISRDLSGADGWDSLEDMFKVLNNTTRYVVMRGFENLKSDLPSSEHADVDVLVDDYKSFIYICNPHRVIMGYEIYRCRPKIELNIIGHRLVLDIWSTHLTYYSHGWQRNMLENAIVMDGIRTLDPENGFFSLVYHCLLRKNATSPDYLSILEKYYNDIYPVETDGVSECAYPMDRYFVRLTDFMAEHGYEFTDVGEANDEHCFFRRQIPMILSAWRFLKNDKHIPGTDVLPYNVDGTVSASGYCYFTASGLDGQTLFIKYGGVGESCKNEFRVATLVSGYDHNGHFLKPLYFSSDVHHPYIVYQFVKGGRLTRPEPCNTVWRDDLRRQFLEIRLALRSAGVMHRDIRPENFMLDGNRLVLTDFQFAITDKERELECLKRDRSIQKGLGHDYRYGRFSWNDSYSFSKVLDRLGLPKGDIPFCSDETMRVPVDGVLEYYFDLLANKALSVAVFARKKKARVKKRAERLLNSAVATMKMTKKMLKNAFLNY